MAYQKFPLHPILNISRIVTLYYFDFSPKYRSKGDIHDFWEIVYVDRGEMGVHAGERFLHMKQGDMIFHQPNEYHDIVCDGNHSASIFIITFDCRSSAMGYFRECILSVPRHLRHYLKELIDECALNFEISKYPLAPKENAPVGGKQMIRMYLEAFLIRLMRSRREVTEEKQQIPLVREEGEDHLVNAISAYLEEHVYGRVTVQELCEYFHFSKSHLYRVYRDATGKTLLEQLTELKIVEAKRLLQEEVLTVSEIADRLAFDSPQYFSRVFRAKTGMTPKAFRERLIKDGAMYIKKR